MDDDADIDTLASRLFATVAAGDIEAVRGMYAPGAVIWLNASGTQTVEENLALLAQAARLIEGFRYEDVRRQITADGFIEQHVLCGRTAGGTELRVPSCIVCTVHEGRITRLEEYLDSAHLAPLFAATRGTESAKNG